MSRDSERQGAFFFNFPRVNKRSGNKKISEGKPLLRSLQKGIMKIKYLRRFDRG